MPRPYTTLSTTAASKLPRRVLLVANPSSGRGRGQRWLERASQRLNGLGVAVDARLTAHRGQAEAWGREAGEHEEVWAIGGDGTLNELCQGMAGSQIPVAVFPAGTGNVVARELGIRRDFDAAFQTAIHGSVREVDVGTVNSRRFLFVLSAGFDATVVDHVARNRRTTMRLWHYVPAILACRRVAEPRFHLTVDGEPAGAACWVAILNSSRYAGSFPLCPGATMDSGHLELLLLRDPVGPRLWRVLRHAARGRLTNIPDCQRRTVRSVRVEAAPHSELDGDPFVPGDLDVMVEPAALRIRTPR